MTNERYKTIPGINIQAPWSELILSGQKTIETRSYPLPKKYHNTPLALIETPGPRKLITKARISGIVVFSHSVLYENELGWKADGKRHLVESNDIQFAFNLRKPKFGWIVKSVIRFDIHLPVASARGIVFTTGCRIPREFLPR